MRSAIIDMTSNFSKCQEAAFFRWKASVIRKKKDLELAAV
jgi:hypothetical protein